MLSSPREKIMFLPAYTLDTFFFFIYLSIVGYGFKPRGLLESVDLESQNHALFSASMAAVTPVKLWLRYCTGLFRVMGTNGFLYIW